MNHIRDLFREYQDGLNVELCFQDFEGELQALPGGYGPPRGHFYLVMEKKLKPWLVVWRFAAGTTNGVK